MIDIFALTRAPRREWQLPKEHGIYALFLRPDRKIAVLPEISELVYVGKAENREGLAGRCHFSGRTLNHSPRKSLAGLLCREIELTPELFISGKKRSRNWGLEKTSDARLSDWMHENLDLALYPCAEARAVEARLIARYQPPLNIDGKGLTPLQSRVKELREELRRRADSPG